MYSGEITATDPLDVYSASGKCFQNISFQLDMTSSMSFDLTVDLQNPKHFGCMETIFIANTEIYHIETFARSGPHVLSFTIPDNYAEEDFAFGGVKTYIFCEDLIKSVESVLRTL